MVNMWFGFCRKVWCKRHTQLYSGDYTGIKSCDQSLLCVVYNFESYRSFIKSYVVMLGLICLNQLYDVDYLVNKCMKPTHRWLYSVLMVRTLLFLHCDVKQLDSLLYVQFFWLSTWNKKYMDRRLYLSTWIKHQTC